VSSLDDITLLCEGVDQRSVDVRLLEIVRQAARAMQPIALRVTIQPAGSKSDMPAAIRAHRSTNSSRRAYAMRDRDFLRGPLLDDERVRAVSTAKEALEHPRAYPLRRHCIESYLIEPDFVEAALEVSGVAAKLSEFAEQRRWRDVSQAALEDVGYRARQARPTLGKAAPHSFEDAVASVSAALSIYEPEVKQELGKPTPEELVQVFAQDFADAGPLWTRVDGKRLLLALEDWFRTSGVLPGGDLTGELLRYAAEEAPPTPLVEEMAAFLALISAH
jgi:hypothetical protein